ncbi:MAG: hypothetical protein HKP58_04800 [Desulfatitalea sp.]|nr:VPLPA-CTERM sorting domain-containing protein [Desulfatitalea sp.]NNJ99711.1 hypothetical protein [Desulfatitalea sp.]
MKKILSGIVFVLFVAFSNVALADFEYGHLNIAVYNEALNSETIYDLGEFDESYLSFSNYKLGNIDIGENVTLSAYVYGIDGQYYGYDVIVAADAEPGIDGSYFSSGYQFALAFKDIQDTFTSGVEHETENANSFVNRMGDNYAGWSSIAGSACIDIADIADSGYIETSLFYYGPDVNDLWDFEHLQTATLRLEETGDLYLMTTVPVPNAAWMLGTGLAALMGLRRKRLG